MSLNYVIGVDGGGTKTVCVLADAQGAIRYVGQGGCSNHQICGFVSAVDEIVTLIHGAIKAAGITLSDIRAVVMGLSGADMDEDIRRLVSELGKRLMDVPLQIVNDIAIAFSAQILRGWGAISICGTGHNTAVVTPDHRFVGVRALRYPLGNFGGGRQLTDDALHVAFRCHENTGARTRLAEELPRFCHMKDMNRLAERIYQSNYTYQYRFPIPKLLFQLADEGDAVAEQVVCRAGRMMGEMAASLIASEGLAEEAVAVVVAGSVFASNGSGFIVRAYTERLRESVPKAELHIGKRPPAVGAVILALQKAGIRCEEDCAARMASEITVRLRKDRGINT